jgi:hypothetical protein
MIPIPSGKIKLTKLTEPDLDGEILQILEIQAVWELFPNYHIMTKERTANSCP